MIRFWILICFPSVIFTQYMNGLGYGPQYFTSSGLNYGSPGRQIYGEVEYFERDKLSGMSVFVETNKQSFPSVGLNSSNSLLNGLAVTVNKNQGSVNGLFGYNFNGKGEGLSLALQGQVSRPGVYHVVATKLARVQEGCNFKTLGDVLDNQQIGYPVYYASNDILATVEMSSNTLKSVYIARLPNFDQLKDLAGRGVAELNGIISVRCCRDHVLYFELECSGGHIQLCLESESDARPCSGYIAACVGLHYTKDDAVFDLQSTTISCKSNQQVKETKSYPSRETNEHIFRDNKLPFDVKSDDLDTDNLDDLATFVPPSTSTPVTYEPDMKLRPKAHVGPVAYF